jgi:hypothetical protein
MAAEGTLHDNFLFRQYTNYKSPVLPEGRANYKQYTRTKEKN